MNITLLKLPSLPSWECWVFSLGAMMQIYLKPLASTTLSVSQMLFRLGLNLKPGMVFHGHPRSSKILCSSDMGLHPKTDPNPTFRDG